MQVQGELLLSVSASRRGHRDPTSCVALTFLAEAAKPGVEPGQSALHSTAVRGTDAPRKDGGEAAERPRVIPGQPPRRGRHSCGMIRNPSSIN